MPKSYACHLMCQTLLCLSLKRCSTFNVYGKSSDGIQIIYIQSALVMTALITTAEFLINYDINLICVLQQEIQYKLNFWGTNVIIVKRVHFIDSRLYAKY